MATPKFPQRRAPWSVVAALVLAATSMPAAAVVIDSSSSDFSLVRSAPTDDPGWNRVGKVGTSDGSGVYLGKGWVLTAAHVGAHAFTLDGQTYAAKANSSHRLTNAGGSLTDLLVYELESTPALGDIRISAARPAANSWVTMIGFGVEQQPGITFWNSSWNEVSSPSGASFYGYGLGGSYAKQWGANLILPYSVQDPNLNVPANSGFGPVSSFVTRFYDSGVNSTLAQAVPGDSGGAVFYKNGSLWELAGIMHATSEYSGQNRWTTVAYGQDTYIADLSVYRDQIVTITAVPEPGAGFLGVTGVSVLACAAVWRRRSENRGGREA